MNAKNDKISNKKPFLTTGKIAKLLHISRMTVYYWIKNKRLKAVRVHQGKYRVSKKDFAEFVKQHGLENHVAPEILTVPTVKILVVDDEPDMVETIKVFLEKANPHYHVVGVTSGFEAGFLIHTFVPDIIILDFVMPGIDCFSICRKIKIFPQTRHIKIIAITGYPSPENLEKIRKEGVSEIIEKPFECRKLLSRVNKLAKN